MKVVIEAKELTEQSNQALRKMKTPHQQQQQGNIANISPLWFRNHTAQAMKSNGTLMTADSTVSSASAVHYCGARLTHLSQTSSSSAGERCCTTTELNIRHFKAAENSDTQITLGYYTRFSPWTKFIPINQLNRCNYTFKE